MTFSVEVKDDGDVDIVLLDPTGCDNDVIVSFTNHEVFMRQEDPDSEGVDIILMHPNMMRDLITAYNQTEGVYIS